MSNNQTQSSSSTSAQLPVGPIAQHLQKIPSSNQQLSPTITQQASANLLPKKREWTGFAGKTLWDWLNLLAILLVPLMIGVFTIVTTLQQSQISQQQFRNSFELSKQQHDSDQKIANDQQQATTLKAYFDDITDLMLNHGLLQSKPGDKVRIVARMSTLISLQELNGDRKGALIQFLYEAKLIEDSQFDENSESPDDAIVSLNGADLSGANLSKALLIMPSLVYGQLMKRGGADPRGIVLSGIDLGGVNLSGADMFAVDLSEANLDGAKVMPEQLAEAYSLINVTLPDGSTYPSQSYPIP